MKRIAFVLLCLVTFLSCQEQQSKQLNVAVAANMQFAMKEITKKFEEETGIHCDLIISSSGKLTAQIKEGAPFDIFVSANMKYPNELYKYGLTEKAPEIYAYGKLILWSMKKDIVPNIDSLKNTQIKHIAISNPKSAPYGIAAFEVLNHFKMVTDLSTKLVYGESVLQTNQFIISNAAEIGFTAKSIVLSPKMKGKGHWIDIDETLYTPISQGAVIIKNKKYPNKNAKQFYDFLFSPKAKEILVNFGYAIKN